MNQPAVRSRPTRRSWYKFSLRSIFIFITLIAIVMGWVTYERAQSRRELQIAEKLQASGAHVTLRDPFNVPPQGRLGAQAATRPSWWRRLLGNIFGPRIWHVGVGQWSSPDLTLLAGLENLHELRLNDTKVSDLAPLAELKKLQGLYLNDTQVTDLKPLARLTNLQRLHLDNTQISDVAPLSGLSKLQQLWLGGTHVSDLAPLAKLNNLRTLYLDFTQVSDLAPLAGLKNLQKLYLNRTHVSDEQVKSLQQVLPNCKIVR
jgi:Leucine-rich repeat (LRR) protein